MKKFILVIFVGINPVVLSNPSLSPFETLKKAPPEIIKVMESSPRTYTFKSRFTSETSVFYIGQVFRNVLMAAIKNSLNSHCSKMGSVHRAHRNIPHKWARCIGPTGLIPADHGDKRDRYVLVWLFLY